MRVQSNQRIAKDVNCYPIAKFEYLIAYNTQCLRRAANIYHM